MLCCPLNWINKHGWSAECCLQKHEIYFKKWRQISFYYSYSYISFHLCLFNFRMLSVSMWSVSISYWYANLGRICKTRRKQSNNSNRKCIFFTSLRNNKLSLWQIIYTQRFINDFAFKWCQIARERLDILEVIGCWTWNLQYCWWNFKFYNRKHQIHPILFPHQSWYTMPNHLSKSHNRKASLFRAVGVLKGTIIEKWIWLTLSKKNEWTCCTRSTGLLNAE